MNKNKITYTSGHLLIHPTIYGRSISSGVVARLIFSNFWFYSPSKSTSLVTINDCVYMGLNSHQWREGIHQKGFINGCGGLFGIFITPVNVISFPPLIYTTANLTENLKIILSLSFFFSWKCTQEIQNEENKTVKNDNSIIFEKSKRRLVLFVISVWSNSKKDQGKPRKFYFLKNSKSSYCRLEVEKYQHKFSSSYHNGQKYVSN